MTLTPDQVRARWAGLRAHDLPRHGGRTLAYVYDSGRPEVDALAREAMAEFAATNGLDPTALDELHRAGVPDAHMPAVQDFANKLILGVALDTREQESYFALPFEQWAAGLSPEARTYHCLPDDPALDALDRLPQWVSARRALLSQRLCGLISSADEPTESTSQPAQEILPRPKVTSRL